MSAQRVRWARAWRTRTSIVGSCWSTGWSHRSRTSVQGRWDRCSAASKSRIAADKREQEPEPGTAGFVILFLGRRPGAAGRGCRRASVPRRSARDRVAQRDRRVALERKMAGREAPVPSPCLVLQSAAQFGPVGIAVNLEAVARCRPKQVQPVRRHAAMSPRRPTRCASASEGIVSDHGNRSRRTPAMPTYPSERVKAAPGEKKKPIDRGRLQRLVEWPCPAPRRGALSDATWASASIAEAWRRSSTSTAAQLRQDPLLDLDRPGPFPPAPDCSPAEGGRDSWRRSAASPDLADGPKGRPSCSMLWLISLIRPIVRSRTVRSRWSAFAGPVLDPTRLRKVPLGPEARLDVRHLLAQLAGPREAHDVGAVEHLVRQGQRRFVLVHGADETARSARH